MSVSLRGKAKKLISLYKDDGQNYDALPFDGKLTTHMFMNLIPGRYSLSIKTRNNVFIRAYNKDVVVFPPPITFNTEQLAHNASSVRFTFRVDQTELDPKSVVIEGSIKSYNQNNTKQSIIHLAEYKIINNVFNIKVPLEYDLYTYSAKAYATTKDGREITLQLPERTFELTAPYVAEVPDEAIAIEKAKALEMEKLKKERQYKLLWTFLGILFATIILAIIVALYLIKRKQKKLLNDDGLSLDELTVDDLQPTSIDLNEEEKQNDDDKISN